MNLLRILAWPISLLYGLAVFIRNKLFDFGIIPSTEIKDIALIGVGNLTVGGTGKTPHVEYLVKMLHSKYKIGTLSRGYGRKTVGFHLATKDATTLEIGDEPKQFRHRFSEDIPVAVDGQRLRGVRKLIEKFPKLQVVILDDVFQHRRIKPGLQIMLTDYGRLFYEDYLMPTGYLREPKSGVRRADIIVVTKTPDFFSPLERKRIIKEISPQPYQKIYFSKIVYGDFVPFGNKTGKGFLGKDYYFENNYSVVLLTGIANSHSLEYFLKGKVKELIPFRFRDHHEFTPTDLLRLQEVFKNVKGETKIVLTTEKDAMRLEKPGLAEYLGDIPVFYIPIEIAFQDKDEVDFNQQIIDYVRPHQVNSHIHPRENE